MPRYFFDITDGGSCLTDESGVELSSDADARREALAVLPAIVREQRLGVGECALSATVRNEAGVVIYGARLTLEGN